MTPHLTGFGEQGAVFTAAYPESLPTVCVRRALRSGRRTFPFRNYVPRKGDPVQLPGWNPVWEDQPTLAEMFLEAGGDGEVPGHDGKHEPASCCRRQIGLNCLPHALG